MFGATTGVDPVVEGKLVENEIVKRSGKRTGTQFRISSRVTETQGRSEDV